MYMSTIINGLYRKIMPIFLEVAKSHNRVKLRSYDRITCRTLVAVIAILYILREKVCLNLALMFSFYVD